MHALVLGADEAEVARRARARLGGRARAACAARPSRSSRGCASTRRPASSACSSSTCSFRDEEVLELLAAEVVPALRVSANAFTGARLDRAGDGRRRDDGWVAGQRADPRARAVPRRLATAW